MKTTISCLILILTLSFASCTSSQPVTSGYKSYNNRIYDTNKHIKEINLGMSKQDVITIMGENYEVLYAKNGTVVLGYRSYDYYVHGVYKLVFVDGKLTEWEKEWLIKNKDQ